LQFGLLTRIAVGSGRCAVDEKITAFMELQSAI